MVSGLNFNSATSFDAKLARLFFAQTESQKPVSADKSDWAQDAMSLVAKSITVMQCDDIIVRGVHCFLD